VEKENLDKLKKKVFIVQKKLRLLQEKGIELKKMNLTIKMKRKKIKNFKLIIIINKTLKTIMTKKRIMYSKILTII
jgi:hypothetical protein